MLLSSSGLMWESQDDVLSHPFLHCSFTALGFKGRSQLESGFPNSGNATLLRTLFFFFFSYRFYPIYLFYLIIYLVYSFICLFKRPSLAIFCYITQIGTPPSPCLSLPNPWEHTTSSWCFSLNKYLLNFLTFSFYVCVPHVRIAERGQKKTSYPLRLE